MVCFIADALFGGVPALLLIFISSHILGPLEPLANPWAQGCKHESTGFLQATSYVSFPTKPVTEITFQIQISDPTLGIQSQEPPEHLSKMQSVTQK